MQASERSRQEKGGERGGWGMFPEMFIVMTRRIRWGRKEEEERELGWN